MSNRTSERNGLDALIHEPARLRMVAVLNECEVADFNFLLGATGLTRGNLSAHMAKLTEAGYVEEHKTFVGKLPHTDYRMTPNGRKAYKRYLADWKRLTQPEIPG
ncbi:MAG: transcriptional regulator [Planctomycetes bacterium]|nr:transcriptional regulator [Planctomycetota bacterium]